MKKALALILALIMLCSSATLISLAADPVAINIEEMPGYKKAYIGAPIAVAPVQDGTINDGEYTFSRKLYPITPDKATSDMSGYNNPTIEHWAYDADYIYYAYENNAIYAVASQIKIRLEHDYIIGATPATFSPHRQYEDADAIQITVNKGANAVVAGEIPAGKEAPTADDVASYHTFTSSYSYANVEFKISRAYLAAQMGLGSASDVTKFTYSTYMQDTKWNGSAWTYLHLDTRLTTSQAAWLTAQGVTSTTGYVSASTASVARVANMVVLGEEPADTIDPMQTVVTNLGLTVAVQPVEKTPVLDGIVSPEEYPTSVVTPTANLSGAASGEVCSENVTEYFGHDGEFVYYAAVYDREADGRAFWPRFKFDNSFDIYNNTHNKWQYALQLRLSNVPHTYQNGNTSYADHDVAVFAGTDGVSKDIMSVAGKDGRTETFEVKISKAFIAAQNAVKGTTADDINVIPYMVWFHNAATLDHVITAADVEAIAAAGGEIATGTQSYRFMVLEGDPDTIEERIEITTNETASVRLSAANPGLRFKSLVNSNDLALLAAKFGAENVKIGTLITLDELRGGAAITADAEFTVVDVAASVDNPFAAGATNVYAGSITNIKPANLAKDFAAVGYIAYRTSADAEWTYIYSDVTAVRNVTFVAQSAVDAGEFEGDTAALDILKQLGAVVA